jgi:hypothetical protein
MFEKANLENIEELAQKKEIKQLYIKTGLMKKKISTKNDLL